MTEPPHNPNPLNLLPSEPPLLLNVTPNSGLAAGGNTVKLMGQRLSGVTSVRFGAAPALSFTVVSDTEITARVPPGSGNVLVTASSPAGTSEGLQYSYVSPPAPPVLQALVPNSGPVVGGNQVTVTGSGLSGVTSVRFGAVAAPSFTVNSDTSLTVVVPPGAVGSVLVTVSSPQGVSNGLPYLYVALPVLQALTPNSGPVAGGNQVIVTGTGLTGVTTVRFGSVTAPSFTVNSDTSLTVVAPPGAVGSVLVTVSSPQGVSNGLPYLYAAAPVLLSVNPTQGPAAGGNTVSLVGSGFAPVTVVSFGGVPVPFTVLSDTSIAAQAPPGPAGPVAITVVGPGGTSAPVTYTRVAGPEI